MAKGGSFELEMCKVFSMWWSLGVSNEVFRKNRRGGRGDMTYREPEGKPLIDGWNIEFKTGYARQRKDRDKKRIFNWCALDPIDGKSKDAQLQIFWDQCNRDAEETNREPVLVFRRPFMSVCICMRQSVWRAIRVKCGPPRGAYLIANVFGETLVIFTLTDFFEWAWPPDVKDICRPKLRIIQ